MIAALLACLVVCAAPWAFGAVEPLWYSLAAAGCLAPAAIELLRAAAAPRRSPARRLPDDLPRGARILLLALPGVPLLALVPLPAFLHGLLSPAGADLYAAAAPPEPPAWRPLSLAPAGTLHALVLAAACAAAFWLVARAALDARRAHALVASFLVCGAALAGFGIVQRLWHYDWRESTIYWTFKLYETTTPFGPYVNRNHFAGAMELFAGVAAGTLLYAAARRRIWAAAASGLALAGILTALVMTTSRGGVLGTVLGAAVLVATAPARARKWVLLGVAAAAAAVLAAMHFAGLLPDLGRLWSVYGRWRNRFEVMEDAVRVFLRHPVFGTGAGTFAKAYPAYQTVEDVRFFNDAHSDWAQFLMETGLAGAAAAAAIVREAGGRIRAALRAGGPDRWFVAGPAAGVAALCVHGLVETNLHVPANALLAAVTLSLTYAAALRRGRASAA